MELSIILNILIVLAFVIDRVFRLKSIKEYNNAKDEILKAKDAQITHYKELLEAEKEKNDVAVTEMFKKRNENLKLILGEKEQEISEMNKSLAEKAVQLDDLKKSATDKKNIEAELMQIRLDKEQLENDKLMLLEFISEVPLDNNINHAIDHIFPGNTFKYSYNSYLKFVRNQLNNKNEN